MSLLRNLKQIKWVICHELAHCMDEHPMRAHEFPRGMLRNVAADYVVDLILDNLVRSGIIEPPDEDVCKILLDYRFKDQILDEVYRTLESEYPPEDEEGYGEGKSDEKQWTDQAAKGDQAGEIDRGDSTELDSDNGNGKSDHSESGSERDSGEHSANGDIENTGSDRSTDKDSYPGRSDGRADTGDSDDDRSDGIGSGSGDEGSDERGSEQSESRDYRPSLEGTVGQILEPRKEDGSFLSESEKKTLSEDWKDAVIQAAKFAKGCGKLDADFADQILERVKTREPWKKYLSAFLKRAYRGASSWERPNRRYLNRGMYLPSRSSKGTMKLGMFDDSSGSVNDFYWSVFTEQSADIINQIPAIEIYHGYFDTKVTSARWIKKSDLPMPMVRNRYGGTNIVPIFEHIERNAIELDALIILTDMEFWDWPERIPNYPVLFCYPHGANVTACGDLRFGKAIEINP
jgi:predicted metal-dependent peptidase